MKLTGDPNNNQKCFRCNVWTPEKYLKPANFLGKERYICLSCYNMVSKRNEQLENIKLEVEVREREEQKQAERSGKSEHPAGEGTADKIEGPTEGGKQG